MDLDNKKEIVKEIRRNQINKLHHEKQMEYYDRELEILNYALKDLEETNN